MKGLTNPQSFCYSSPCPSWGIHGGVAQLARAFGSYPECHWFESSRRYQFGKHRKMLSFIWPVGQVVKTPPFHGGNTSSSLVRVTTSEQVLLVPIFLCKKISIKKKHRHCRCFFYIFLIFKTMHRRGNSSAAIYKVSTALSVYGHYGTCTE